jgi:hypothetical protein
MLVNTSAVLQHLCVRCEVISSRKTNNWNVWKSFSGLADSFILQLSRSKSKSRYNWRSVRMSRYRAHSETCYQTLLSVQRFFSESCCLVYMGRPLWREVGSVICPSQSVVIYEYLHQSFTLLVFYSSAIYIQYDTIQYSYIWNFIQSRLSTADYALLVIISPNYRSSLDTWTVA